MTLTTRKMSDRHEEDLAEALDGRTTRNSGAVWVDQTDGKTDADLPFTFAWDAKATLGQGITVTRKMWAKVTEQAESRFPAVGLRWYRDERLTQVDIDLVAVPVSVFADMLDLANRMALIEQGEHDGR